MADFVKVAMLDQLAPGQGMTVTVRGVPVALFNVGRKPHSLVKEQMHRFMEEIAPAFEGSHGVRSGYV